MYVVTVEFLIAAGHSQAFEARVREHFAEARHADRGVPYSQMRYRPMLELIAELRVQAEALQATTDYALVGSGVIGGGIFEQPCRTVGMEPFMMSLLTAPEFSARLVDGITDIYIESVDRYLAQMGVARHHAWRMFDPDLTAHILVKYFR